MVAQRFGERIDSAHSLLCGDRLRGVDLGVDHAPAVVERFGFAKEDIFVAGVVALLYLFYPFEPHHFHGGPAVGEHAHEPCFRTFALH